MEPVIFTVFTLYWINLSEILGFHGGDTKVNAVLPLKSADVSEVRAIITYLIDKSLSPVLNCGV